jgi:hypothetical protein
VQISISAVAAILLIVFFTTLYMANADSFLASPVQPHEKQDAMKMTITDGLRLANQSSQRWQNSQADQQEQPLSANGIHTSNKFDNQAPSVLSGLSY